MMVIWADFPQGAVEHRSAYVAGGHIAEWLRSRPHVLAQGRVASGRQRCAGRMDRGPGAATVRDLRWRILHPDPARRLPRSEDLRHRLNAARLNCLLR